MSTRLSTQGSVRSQDNGRGRGTNKSRGGRKAKRGGGSGVVKDERKELEKVDQVEDRGRVEDVLEVVNTDPSTVVGEAVEEEDVCWICAEPVKYWAVSECNHRTCHVCALRLRALYKKTDCTFCKEPQPMMIFTTSNDAEFITYKPDDIQYKDIKLSICFENPEMMEETLILLKFNCPDVNCDYIGNGWADLKLHTRAVHGKLMCDLCIRHKKVFSHEHALYQPNLLPIHLPSIYHRHVKQISKEKVEGGVHPICEFCKECFFGVDEHYGHMRERHEECFICKRNGVQFQYFQTYDHLERHFNTGHYPCIQPECRERKFVVFNTALDLQAHRVEEHGATMSSRDKKDAMNITTEFQFEESGGRHGRRDRGTAGVPRERDREPPPVPQQVNSRRAAFRSTLTDGSTSQPPCPSPSGSSSPLVLDSDPAVAERHAAFLVRLQSLVPNPANGIPAAKAAIRGYRASESSARDLILTIFKVLDDNLDKTASIVNGLVDLLDEEEKKQELLASWRGFDLEQRRQFPDLVPQVVGGGYAGITSGRVLNAKNSTASRSSRPSRQVWDRVAAAASYSSVTPQPRKYISAPTQKNTFPPLPGALSSSSDSRSAPIPGFRKPTHITPWSASASAAISPRIIEPHSITDSQSPEKNRAKPPKLDKSLFPELPSSSTAKGKPKIGGNTSLKHILGNSTPPISAWQGGSGGNSDVGEGNIDSSHGIGGEGDGDEVTAGKKGKKGKGKQKQTLFTLGSFPA